MAQRHGQHLLRRSGRVLAAAVTAAIWCATTTQAAYDDDPLTYPLEGLCRRWDHSSAVVDNKLYLLGGYVLMKDDLKNKSTVQFAGEPSSEFIYLDLTESFNINNSDPAHVKVPWKAVDVSNEDNVNLALAASGMWTSDDTIWIYDGLETKNGSVGDKSSMLSFDTKTKKLKEEATWTQSDGKSPSRYSKGTAVNAPEIGMGFYVGGARLYEDEDGENQEWIYPRDQQFLATGLGAGEFKHDLTTLHGGLKTIGAAAAYLPVGEKGILVLVGGTQETIQRAQSGAGIKDEKPTDETMTPRAGVWIYDIAADEWYNQTVTGNPIPAERQDGCLVAMSAPDNSSHQIYYFGGASGTSLFGMDDVTYFGDVYILDLPSFEWYKFDELGNPATAKARHTCHVVNNRQLLILGGTRNDTEYQPDTEAGEWLKHNCTWDEISLLDLPTLEWKAEYTPTTEPYSVPSQIMDNSKANGVVKTGPATGWDDDRLAKLFGAEKKGLSAGAKAGIAIGVVLTVLIAAGVAWFFWKRGKTHKEWKKDRLTAQDFDHESAQDFTSRLSEIPGSPVPPYSSKHSSTYKKHDAYSPNLSEAPGHEPLQGHGISEAPGENEILEMPEERPIFELQGEGGEPAEFPAEDVKRNSKHK